MTSRPGKSVQIHCNLATDKYDKNNEAFWEMQVSGSKPIINNNIWNQKEHVQQNKFVQEKLISSASGCCQPPGHLCICPSLLKCFIIILIFFYPLLKNISCIINAFPPLCWKGIPELATETDEVTIRACKISSTSKKFGFLNNVTVVLINMKVHN